MEYEDAKAKEKAAIDKAKNKDELVQKQMHSFEVGRGALPPGSKGLLELVVVNIPPTSIPISLPHTLLPTLQRS
jgi:hypothetical protein